MFQEEVVRCLLLTIFSEQYSLLLEGNVEAVGFHITHVQDSRYIFFQKKELHANDQVEIFELNVD